MMDFNRGGIPDLLFQNQATGSLLAFYLGQSQHNSTMKGLLFNNDPVGYPRLSAETY